MAKRGAKGSGTLRKKTVNRNGKQYVYWEGRVTVGRDPGTGRQIQRSFSGKSQKEVLERMQAAAVEVSSGVYTPPSKLTVGQWLDLWQANYLGGVKPLTVRAYEKNVRVHIKPALGAVKLDSLTPYSVQEFINRLGAGLSPQTVKCVHSILHKALQQASAIGLLRDNPADNCVLPRRESCEVKPLYREQIASFLKAVQGHRFEAVYLTTLFTGMRQGEVLGLTWDCVDLERGQIVVQRQLQSVPGSPGETRLVPTKSGKSRKIAAAPTVLDILKGQRAHQNAQRLQAGENWTDSGLVFTDALGRPLSSSTVYHNYKRIAASIGLPASRFHDLRHSYAVAALQSGDDVKTVQEALGHHTAAFTLDVYGHVTEEMKQRSAEHLEQFIQDVSSL